MPNKNVVYFLGAGSSYNFGYPLTKELMPEILDGLFTGTLFAREKTDKEKQKQLLDYLGLIYPGQKRMQKNRRKNVMPDITKVLSFVDHLCFYNIPPHPKLNEEKMHAFQHLLNRSITEVLMKYHFKDYTDDEEELLKIFFDKILDGKGQHPTIITTNYDLVVDGRFESEMDANKVDLGFPYRHLSDDEVVPQPLKPVARYYKLHGSLNWLKCELCGQYYVNPAGLIAHQPYRENTDANNTCVCNNHLKLKTVLVAPSMVRDIRDSNLLQIWKASAEAIRKCDELVFIGYSMPSEDLAIQAMIMRGINGRGGRSMPKITVVQKGDSQVDNYYNMFGSDIRLIKDGLTGFLQIKHKS